MRCIKINPYTCLEVNWDLASALEPQGEGGIESDIRACSEAIGALAAMLVEMGCDLQRVAKACGISNEVRLAES